MLGEANMGRPVAQIRSSPIPEMVEAWRDAITIFGMSHRLQVALVTGGQGCSHVYERGFAVVAFR